MKDQARPHDFRAIWFRLDIYYRYAARHMRWLNWRIGQIGRPG